MLWEQTANEANRPNVRFVSAEESLLSTDFM